MSFLGQRRADDRAEAETEAEADEQGPSSPVLDDDEAGEEDGRADEGGGGGGDDDEEEAATGLPPLTMSASTVLLGLPRDATAALAAAGAFERDKVVVRFKAVGAPPLGGGGGRGGGGRGGGGRGDGGDGGDVRRKIAATQTFDAVVAFVRRALRVRPSESVFLYVNSTFAPALDEVVGNLHQCFRDANDQLNVSYSLSPAFG